ncbi:MAG: DUF2267 domain-containing protein [Marinosulfonomonas sp.]|nr:DUF2267 domain-containing protein [Marinosulfonomonas sp.]
MSAKGLEVIDHTVQTTHEWINELKERLDWVSHRDALHLLRVTLTGVRDHLSHEEVADFAAQLPLLIRGMFYEGWQPATTPFKDRSQKAFVDRIEKQVAGGVDYRGVEDISTVFKLLNARISSGEVSDMRGNLPSGIRDLWPE